MARYTGLEPSQEGFFDAVTKFAKACLDGVARSTALNSIDYSDVRAPEVCGVRARGYRDLIAKINSHVIEGGAWDACITVGRVEVNVDPVTGESKLSDNRCTVVLIGQGKEVTVRLPVFVRGSGGYSLSQIIKSDLKLTQVN